MVLVPKFNGSNFSLFELEEKLKSAVCLYQAPAWLIAELAINELEDDAHQVLMVLPEDEWASLEQIVACLEGLFRENTTVSELRWRFLVPK